MTTHLYYDENKCAYCYGKQIGCTRCLTVCPNQAISIVNQKITVDFQVCDESGNCITACPTGALTNTVFTLPQHIALLQQKLQSFYQQHGKHSVVLFHDIDLYQLINSLSDVIVSIEINQLNSFGIESWLTCLVNGARKVIFLYQLEAPIEIVTTLDSQLQYARILLHALGYDKTALQLIGYQEINYIKTELTEHFSDETDKIQIIPLNNNELLENKRDVLRIAMNHLYQNAPHKPVSVDLPTDAPFGQVLLNNQACTLCFSCVTVCPTHAFSAGQQQPQLYFSEHLCIQCQLCVKACPENVLTLQPRFAFLAQLEQTTRLLHEELPFQCISCGKAFATQTMINSIMKKLQNHAMFQGEAAKRLQMCETCRIKAIVHAENK